MSKYNLLLCLSYITFPTLQIDVSDDLPKFVCQPCILDLNNACKFKAKCELADHKFRYLIKTGIAPVKNAELSDSPQCTNRSLDLDTPCVLNNNMLNTSGASTILTISAESAMQTVLAPIVENDDERTTQEGHNIANTSINGNIFLNLNADCNGRVQANVITGNEQIVRNLDRSNCVSFTEDSRSNTIAVTSPSKRRCSVRIVKIIDKSNAASTSNADNAEDAHIDTAAIFEAQNDDNHSFDLQPMNVCADLETSPKQSVFAYDCEEGPLHCNKCEKELEKKPRLKQQMPAPIKCSFCKRKFASKFNLNRHMKTHLPLERSYACEVCKKSFTSKQNLKEHNWIHSDTSPVCSTCNKTFSCPTALYRHKKLHLVKPFLCDICKRVFKTRREIKIHMLVHEWE